ncbi:MAG: restriction endonuclease subunit S [Planctomycetota bacterium]|nr:MAG: restriction endonuclease subunit S [Planctomycetota bacterium]
MTNWKETTLDEIADFRNGKGLSNDLYTDNGKYPVWGSNGQIASTDELLNSDPVIVIGRVGAYCGSVYHIDEPSWVTDNAIVAEAKGGNDLRFLYYLLKKLDIARTAIGSAQPLMTQGGLKVIPALVPADKKEQKRIAHILGSLDDKIELNRRTNKTLEAMARAIFQSWFVDFDPVLDNALAAGNPIPAELKEKAIRRKQQKNKQPLPKEIKNLFPDSFQKSPLGPIPKGWKVSTIGTEFDLTMGQSPPGESYNETGDGVVFYQGRRDFGFRFPAPRVYCNDPKRFAEKSDTLVSVRAPVGDVNMADEKCCIGRGVGAARHKSGSRSYTYYTMHHQGDMFKTFDTEGTVFGSISKKDFENMQCINPDPATVKLYEQKAFAIDEQIEINEQENKTLTQLRDTLLPKLLTGKIEV